MKENASPVNVEVEVLVEEAIITTMTTTIMTTITTMAIITITTTTFSTTTTTTTIMGVDLDAIRGFVEEAQLMGEQLPSVEKLDP